MCHECFCSLLYTQKLFIRNTELILIEFLIYRIYFGGLRLTGDYRKPFAWQQVCHQVGEHLPPASVSVRAESSRSAEPGVLLESSARAQA